MPHGRAREGPRDTRGLGAGQCGLLIGEDSYVFAGNN